MIRHPTSALLYDPMQRRLLPDRRKAPFRLLVVQRPPVFFLPGETRLRFRGAVYKAEWEGRTFLLFAGTKPDVSWSNDRLRPLRAADPSNRKYQRLGYVGFTVSLRVVSGKMKSLVVRVPLLVGSHANMQPARYPALVSIHPSPLTIFLEVCV